MNAILAMLVGSIIKPDSIVTPEFLHDVAIIESNVNNAAIGKDGERGAFQIKREAWADAVSIIRLEGNEVLFTERHYEEMAHEYEFAIMAASALMRCYEQRMLRDGYKPTPIRLYMAYNLGYAGAKRIKFNPNSDSISFHRKAIFRKASKILNR